MHIAIDDTYGPEQPTGSKYVTGARRTHVAVIFSDNHVEEVRSELKSCIEYVREEHGIMVEEFHFTDVYNKRKAWKGATDELNLTIIKFFAAIYQRYRWKVRVQTVDDRTFADFNIAGFRGKLDGLDFSRRDDVSLALLLVGRLKPMFPAAPHRIKLFVDEGRGKPGARFGRNLFESLGNRFEGRFERSTSEPLLQIADFFAFAINRCTYLSMKPNRSEMDNWFLHTIGSMEIDCPELLQASLDPGFTVDDFDMMHMIDRLNKGLPPKML